MERKCEPGVDFNMIIAGDGSKFDTLVRRCLEGLVVDFEAFGARAVQLAKDALNSRLLAGPRRSVH